MLISASGKQALSLDLICTLCMGRRWLLRASGARILIVRTGMVAETGEATARFLKSIARGEIDPKDSLDEQARAGLKRVRSMRNEERPGDCRLASRQLVRSHCKIPYLCTSCALGCPHKQTSCCFAALAVLSG